ncbi:cell division protein FtsA [Candidatus Finniella inopinata]|uniref:Cell division protein FtsA n=1 Tax=Candidatus Finniella inopinata TaxID=1696036 RepID=A0A4Q7DJY3_9PROT|nr:cell division protein FtsA [Candidatus Finniella inopinata]RZI47062.1 cell division protein FtsA [Candidatus Finniella inopinata]
MSFFTKKLPIQRKELFAALDIGSSKVCCAIAKLDGARPSPDDVPMEGRSLRVVGVGYQLSKGLKSGAIIDLESLEDSILSAVQNAEQAARQNINSVYVSLPASFTQSHILRTEISLSGNPVDESHLRRLLNLNYEGIVKNNRHIIHILPLSYTLDSITGIRDPKGMVGETLSATLHVVSAPLSLIRNLSGCIGRCHLDIAGYVSSAYASGLATLVEDELELGVTVIDMGGSQTTIASFINGTLVRINSIPLGGGSITADIARGLGTPLAQAERLKTLYGTLMPSSSDDRENIFIQSMGETDNSYQQHVSKGMLIHIIRSRVEEILDLVSQKMKTSEVDPLVYQRLVITGGASQLQGLREVTGQLLTKQVRLGLPMGLTGTVDMINNPAFSTCAGLLFYALQDYNGDQVGPLAPAKWQIAQRLGLWFKENF